MSEIRKIRYECNECNCKCVIYINPLYNPMNCTVGNINPNWNKKL